MTKYITIERVLLGAVVIILAVMLFGKKDASLGVVSNASRFDSDVYVNNSLEVAGTVTQGGTVEAISTALTAYTLPVASVCNDSYIKMTGSSTALTTVTLPATTTLLASCLTNIGEFRDVNYESSGSSTVIAAGAGMTFGYTSSSTVAAAKHGLLRFVRDGLNTVDVYLVNILN